MISFCNLLKLEESGAYRVFIDLRQWIAALFHTCIVCIDHFLTDHVSARVCQVCRQCCKRPVGDRKSTRLNSSHVSISYAVFCLKKKKNKLQVACGLCIGIVV